MTSPTLVEVTWLDSAFHRGWNSLETKRKEMALAPCRTAGYLVAADRHAVKVVLSVSDGDGADGITIPRAVVQKIRRLR